jgi:hypothetical protein
MTIEELNAQNELDYKKALEAAKDLIPPANDQLQLN